MFWQTVIRVQTYSTCSISWALRSSTRPPDQDVAVLQRAQHMLYDGNQWIFAQIAGLFSLQGQCSHHLCIAPTFGWCGIGTALWLKNHLTFQGDDGKLKKERVAKDSCQTRFVVWWVPEALQGLTTKQGVYRTQKLKAAADIKDTNCNSQPILPLHGIHWNLSSNSIQKTPLLNFFEFIQMLLDNRSLIWRLIYYFTSTCLVT